MILEMAPMEGVTNYIYRQVFAKYYGGIDRYYTPFLSPNQNRSFLTKEWNEIKPENNEGIDVAPQILSNRADTFMWAVEQIQALGYREVNLNLGCPSGTVTAKKKGSGALADLGMLKDFLDEIFWRCPLEISIKTRIGVKDPEEFDAILELYRQYPIKELIVHPRVQKQFYKGELHPEAYEKAYRLTNAAGDEVRKSGENATEKGQTPQIHSFDGCFPVSFNGMICTREDAEKALAAWPQTHALMLGRGLIANPALALEIKGTGQRDKATLRAFCEELTARNKEVLSGDTQLLGRMKEVWFYLLPLFTNYEEYQKPFRKARTYAALQEVLSRLFNKEELAPDGKFEANRAFVKEVTGAIKCK